MCCKFCKAKCRKAARQRNGAQKLYCKVCKRYQQSEYQRNVYKEEVRMQISRMMRESVSNRGIARLLRISVKTVSRQIKKTAEDTQKPEIPLDGSTVEVDELRTYVGRKDNPCWIAYAFHQHTGRVIDFIIGRRTKLTLSNRINRLLDAGACRIFTDGLNIYRSLIPRDIHFAGKYCTNRIERNNVTIGRI